MHINSVVFIHIPKCGGTSVDRAIREAIGRKNQPRIHPVAARKAGQVIAGTDAPLEFARNNTSYLNYLLCYHLNLRWKFVSGHLPVTGKVLDYYSDCSFITIMRKPAERWKSHYLFNKMNNSDPMAPPSKYCSGSLADELYGILSGDVGEKLGSMITMMLSGYYPSEIHSPEELVAAAGENLDKFSLVGFLENLPDFTEGLAAITGKKIEIDRLNPTDKNYQGAELEKYTELRELLNRKDVAQMIEKCCRMDNMVHEYALSAYSSI